MRAKRKKALPAPSAFWDASGIVPLCCFQPQSGKARQTARLYGYQIVWWATVMEIVSSFNRLIRQGQLTIKEGQQAFGRLDYLRRRWHEIQPIEEIRDRAERLLGIHNLRAAEAFQLAAALVWCSHRPRDRHFIGSDGNLSDAAESEGFIVIRLL